MFRIFVFILLTCVVVASLSAQDQSILRKKHFNLEDGIAIQGFDPVTYFTLNKAVKGNKDVLLVERGVVYYFSNNENRELFKKNPEKYAPEYGGWCAYAMGSKGEKVSIDPGTFKIVNNRLYLFYNHFFNNTLKDWNKDEVNLKTMADNNWNKLNH